MSDWVTIICTNGGRHSRTELQAYTVQEGVALVERKYRVAKFQGGVTDEGETVADRAIVPWLSARDDFEGRPRYRFRCPKCPMDRPVTEPNLLALVVAALAAGDDSLDVSRRA